MYKTLIFVSIISVVLARPDGLLNGDDGHVSVTQSSAGTYKYTVHLKDSTRKEERLADGTIFGEYSVPDVNGGSRTIKFTSGRDGFRVLEGGDSPIVAPVEAATSGSDVPLAKSETHDNVVSVAENSGLNVPLAKSSESFLPL